MLQYLKSKRFLYTICFAALMLIDWTRGSQIGVVWAWTVNMQGVVMGVFLLSFCDRKLLRRKIYYIYTAICAVAIPVSYSWWFFHQESIYRDQLLSAVLNVWVLGFFVIYYALQYFGESRESRKGIDGVTILTVVMFLWILISANEDVWSLWYLVMFFLLSRTTLTKEDRKTLSKGMIDGILISFFALQGAAFIFRPFDSPHWRYSGIYANCNINALFYTIVLIAFLLKYYELRKQDALMWRQVLCFLFICAMYGFIALTISMSAACAAGAAGLLYLIMVEHRLLHRTKRQLLLQVGAFLLVFMISVPVNYLAVRYLPALFHHPIWYDGEYSEDKVHSFDAWDSEKYASFEEYMNASFKKIIRYANLISNRMGLSLQVDAEEYDWGLTIGDEFYSYNDQSVYANSAFLGRLAIWSYYIEEANIMGHSNTEGHDIGDGGYMWHAQNVFLQYMFYYGIPAMILLGIYLSWGLGRSLRQINSGNDQALIPLLFFAAFLVEGLFEAVWYPGQMILWMIFFSVVFWDKDKNETKNINCERQISSGI